jgi:hypothetical protein
MVVLVAVSLQPVQPVRRTVDAATATDTHKNFLLANMMFVDNFLIKMEIMNYLFYSGKSADRNYVIVK